MNLFFKLTRITGLFLLFSFTCWAGNHSAFSSELDTDKNKRVNFEFRDQSMAEVARQISAQLDYKVLMDDDLAALQVSGLFKNVTLDEFFSRRIFQGKNIAILFDDKEQVVTIRSFGKKAKMTQYDQTNFTGSDSPVTKTDPEDMEIQPGVMRRDVVQFKNEINPMDQEIQPGITRRNVVRVKRDDIVPSLQEVQPGIKRGDVVQVSARVDPNEVEIQPGIKRSSVAEKVPVKIDPMDMEVQPGIKRGDVTQFHTQ